MATYLWSAAANLTLPGIQYDEVLQTPSAIHLVKGEINGNYRHFGSFTVGGRTFALMSYQYIGALKAYLFALVFSVFGIHVTAFRLTNILVTIIGLLFTSRFARAMYGRQVSVVGVWLVATDPSLVLYSRSDYGPMAIAFALRAAALLFLYRWWKSAGKNTYALILAGALLGLGIYDKTNFLWFIVALMGVGAAAWSINKNRPRLTFIPWFWAVLAGLLASAPLWIYNLSEHWITFRLIARPGEEASLTRLLGLLPERTAVLKNLLDGRGFDVLMCGEKLSPCWGVSHTLLLPLSLFAMLALIAIAILKRRWRWLFLPLVMLAMAAQIYLTPRLIGGHHWIGIYPFPHLAVALTLVTLWKRVVRQNRWRTVCRWLGTAVVVLAVSANLLVLASYRRLLHNTGGAGAWSAEIYQLADLLQRRYPDRPIQLMDWGLGNTLFFLSQGQLYLRESFNPYRQSSQPQEELRQLVADTNNIFVVNAPASTVFPGAPIALASAAQQSGMVVREEQGIYDQRQRLVYKIITFAPQK